MASSSIWQSPPPDPSEWVKGKLVGSGSFGTVHLAMNKSTGGLFVVKSARRSSSSSSSSALENEVKILQSLRPSPYIVECLGTEEDECGNVKNVWMEYMGGGNLADVAVKFGGSLDEEVVRVYTREILRGLQHVHEHGIVHCDLKCKNVLLGSAGNIKLADFGCAKRVGAMMKKKKKKKCDHQIGVSGTPLWMAPEVLRNDYEMLDVAADIWSLGCTVIEMATGRPPNWADDELISSSNNPMAVLLKIAHGDRIPQFPSHFSMEGLDFLTNCFHRDPTKRCTAQQLLSHPFVAGGPAMLATSLKDQYASSPTSVLELQGFEEEEFDDDEKALEEESINPHDDDDGNNNSSFYDYELLEYFGTMMTTILCRQRGGDREDIDTTTALGSSGGNWITVRSSG